jgi:hypothetical protein
MAWVLALVVLFGSLRALAPMVEITLPGDTLYPVKMTIEGIQIAATLDPVTRAQIEFTVANTRVKEIQQLADRQRYSQIPATAHEYEGAVQNATQTLNQVIQQDLAGHVTLAQQAASDLLQNSAKLELVQQATPAEIQPGIAHAVDASHQAQASVKKQLEQPNRGSSGRLPAGTPEPRTRMPAGRSVLTDTIPLEPGATAVSLPTTPPLATETPIPPHGPPSNTPANMAVPPTSPALPPTAIGPEDPPVRTTDVESPANSTHPADKKKR